jgi:hypothetical protein
MPVCEVAAGAVTCGLYSCAITQTAAITYRAVEQDGGTNREVEVQNVVKCPVCVFRQSSDSLLHLHG